MENSTTKHRLVLAMPYPGRGHINPMLNLCKLILSKSSNLFITFVVTEEWLGLLSSELHHKPANLAFVALPQVIPSEIGRGEDFPGFIEAISTKLQEPFERLLDQLELQPKLIVYDTLLGWVVSVGNQRKISVASFVPFSASHFAILSNVDLLVKHGHFAVDVSERGNEVVDYIPGLPATTVSNLPQIYRGDGRKMRHRVLEAIAAVHNAQHLLFSSISEFEGQVINGLKAKFNTQMIYQIGPMIPYFNLDNDTGDKSTENYFQWLNSQPRGSVLYISQGSFLSVSSDQIEEFIAGVKESKVRFLWVTRCDTKRFKDGVTDDEMGYFVPWCDQLRVLCHPCVGGFWTHCGWNSISEGIYAGVPMLTYPICVDQIPNSKMIVKDLKIGWNVINNNSIKRGELVTRQFIVQLVRRFMDPENGERKEMIRRANELKNTFRKAIINGGSAASDIDAFIKNI